MASKVAGISEESVECCQALGQARQVRSKSNRVEVDENCERQGSRALQLLSEYLRGEARCARAKLSLTLPAAPQTGEEPETQSKKS